MHARKRALGLVLVGQMTHVKMNVDLLDPRCILTASYPRP